MENPRGEIQIDSETDMGFMYFLFHIKKGCAFVIYHLIGKLLQRKGFQVIMYVYVGLNVYRVDP